MIEYQKGEKINELTFIKELPPKNKSRRALFQCFCGNIFITHIGAVRSGNTLSCGCYKINKLMIRNTTHGLTKHPLHKVWGSIKDRCLNINAKAFKNYGGRGITICKKWEYNFKIFYDWSIQNGYKKGLTIERIDNDKGYFPENCTFATRAEQSHNTRATKLTWEKVNEIRSLKGKIYQCEIANIYGVNGSCIQRIFNNNTWVK